MTKQNENRQAVTITEENILQIAGKAAYHVVRTQYIKVPTETNRKLINGFAYLKETNNDTTDIIQVAAAVLWENKTSSDAFFEACKEVRRYIYSLNPQQQKTAHTPLYKALPQVRKILKGQNISASPTRIAELKQVIADKGITLENIDNFIAEKKSQAKKSYNDTNMYIHDKEHSYTSGNGEIENVNNEITKLLKGITDNDTITEIVNALKSPQQKQVLKYMAFGYSNSGIAEKMGISKPRVSQHIDRIRAIGYQLNPNGIAQ